MSYTVTKRVDWHNHGRLIPTGAKPKTGERVHFVFVNAADSITGEGYATDDDSALMAYHECGESCDADTVATWHAPTHSMAPLI